MSPLSASILFNSSVGRDRPVDLQFGIPTIFKKVQVPILLRSAPLDYKYMDENIPRAIATAIFENKKQSKKDRINYNALHRRIVRLLKHSISQRQFGKQLNNMLHEKILNRYDPKGKRGSRVYFSLTQKGEKKYGLMILGNGKEVQRRKRLCSLLISFEVYKRGPLLTERQLSELLKALDSSINDFKKSKEITQAYSIPRTFHKSIKGLEILGIPSSDRGAKSSKMLYYTVVPGFSVEEFIKYQNALKNGREPRPFLGYPTRVPFALTESYTKKEVEEAVVSLKESGLVESIGPVLPDEKRYNTTEPLRGLARTIWLVGMIDYQLLISRLLYNRPSDQDKRYLGIYIGEIFVDKVIANAYDIRRSNKEERQIHEQAIRELGERRTHLVQEITSKFDKVIQENEIIRDIVGEICYPPFLSSEANQP